MNSYIGSSRTVSTAPSQPMRSYSNQLAHRVPGRHSWRYSTVRVSAGSSSPTGAIAPTSCQRRPSAYSLTSKCVDSVGKLTGAHSQKNCGSPPTGAPVGAGSPTGRTPHDRSREPSTSARRQLDPLAVDLDPAGPRAELGEAGVVEERPCAGALEEVRFLDGRRAAVEREVGAQTLLGRVDEQLQPAQRLDHLAPRSARRWSRRGRSAGARPDENTDVWTTVADDARTRRRTRGGWGTGPSPDRSTPPPSAVYPLKK